MIKKFTGARSSLFVLSDASRFSIESAQREKKILVAGDAVFTTTDVGQEISDFYAEQIKRQGTSLLGYLQGLGARGLNLRVSVARSVIEELPKARVGFAIDGYLRWGLMRTQRTVLLGGASNSEHTVMDVLVFEKGRLIEKDGRMLPTPDSLSFADAVQSVVKELREKYAGARMFQAAPLPDFNLADVTYLGKAPLSKVSYRPLHASSEATFTQSWSTPAAIFMAGGLAYGALIGMGWVKYSQAKDEFQTAIDHPAIREAGGVDQGYLSIMQQRRLFMEEPRRQLLLSDKAGEIVRGVAHVDGIRVVEMQMPAPTVGPASASSQVLVQTDAATGKGFSGDRRPDVSMTISVPAAKGPALEQARDVMMTIARETGMDLRLAQQGGWREDAAHDRRIFVIEGLLQ